MGKTAEDEATMQQPNGAAAISDTQKATLWKNVRRRRIHQICRMRARTLQQLACKVFEKSTPELSSSTPTKNEIRVFAKFELATRLAKYFEDCYGIAIDENREKQVRLSHLHKLKEICDDIDEQYLLVAIGECRGEVTTTSKKRKANNNGNVTPANANISSDTGSSTSNDFFSKRMERINAGTKENTSTRYSNNVGSENVFNQEVTPGDLPMHSSKSATKNIDSAKEQQKINQQIKHDEIDNFYKKTILSQNRSKKNQTFSVHLDSNRIASSVVPRHAGTVSFDPSLQVLPPWDKRQIDERLRIWEPNWVVVQDLSLDLKFFSGFMIAPISSSSCNKDPDDSEKNNIYGCARIPHIKIPKVDNCSDWGTEVMRTKEYKNGDCCLLLRSLPLESPPPKYKADTHQWPKGTYIQFTNDSTKLQVVPKLLQRRQQQHDRKLWKGNSNILDLSSYCSQSSRHTFTLEVTTMENSTSPSTTYALQLALCRYKSTDVLQQELEKEIPHISYSESLLRAQAYVTNHTVDLLEDDSSDDDEPVKKLSSSSSSFQVFALNCPISMMPMRVPVRGKDCDHMQCYDLSSFLESNKYPSGPRWRCICCDSLISVHSLVVCDLTSRMIAERGDRVEQEQAIMWGDGRWQLEKKEKKMNCSEANEPPTIRGKKRRKFDTKVTKSSQNAPETRSNRKNKSPEIILLS